MITIAPETTVRDIVVAYPQARRLFEAQGIDYCCNGGMTLTAAAKRAGQDYVQLVSAVEQLIQQPPPGDIGRDWSQAPLAELVDHILDTHHAFSRKQLSRIDGLLTTVAGAHRRHAEMLLAMRQVFDRLHMEIEQHLLKEEMILFPYIKQLQPMIAGFEPYVPMHCGSVARPIEQMQHEHDSAGAALSELRRLSSGYALPPDGCPTFAELYQSLQELEIDLHEHIHLENNILFPRAMQAERSFGLPQGA